jgi:NhaP-type Na+/H+ or K+/H+ antiporter
MVAGYGFLAVFAAGLALRNIEVRENRERPIEEVRNAAQAGANAEIAADPREVPIFMTQAVLEFNEQLERIGEVAVVVLVGGLLAGFVPPPAALVWFLPLLFLVIRPLAVWFGLLGEPLTRLQLALTGWFGIRGIGSIYYLMYAIAHGLEADLSRTLTGIVVWTVAVSVLVHGLSVTPLMNFYGQLQKRG